MNDEDDNDRKYSSSTAIDESEEEEENEEVIASDEMKLHEKDEQSEHTTSSPTIDKKFIGIIDLRPNPEPESLIFMTETIQKDQTPIHSCATFPPVEMISSDNVDGDFSLDEMTMDQQAAASHTIGKVCSEIYLVISYDFDNGKTVLHRSLGGVKLMNFMDGLRKRWDDHDDIHANDRSRLDVLEPMTNLVIILVPSSISGTLSLLTCLPDGKREHDDLYQSSADDLSVVSKVVVDLKGHSNMNVSGAYSLLDRLKSYFAMGGDKYDAIDPFGKVEMLGIWETRQEESDHQDGKGMKEVVLKHYLKQNRNGFDGGVEHPPATEISEQQYRDIVNTAYSSAGGVGDIIF